MAPASIGSHLVFGDFLEHLRRQGFLIGVDHYLRLQEVLNKISDKCSPYDLKTLLCPILATSPVEQEQFYRAFETYFDLFHSADPKSTPGLVVAEAALIKTEEPKSMAPRKSLYVVAGTLAMALILAVGVFITRNQTSPESPSAEPVKGAAHAIETNPPGGNTPPAAATAQIEPPPQQPPAKTIPLGLTFYQRYGSTIRFAAVATPLIFLLIYELYRFNRRKLVLHKQRGKKPPYVWPLRIEKPNPSIYDSEQFYTTARRMRRRRIGEFHRLDVSATIDATVDSLGYPSFRYKPDSNPPEYLVLIDRASFRDHQSQLFNELAKALDEEGLFIASYFYDGDPRVCRSETGDSIHLIELQNKYSEHRLLIFGNGEKTIDPLTGNLETWTATLLDWKERAVLTPEASSKWGLREITLASQFIVLPATLDGLLDVVDHFESPATTNPSLWQHDELEAPPAEPGQAEIVEALRNYLGEEVFQWLCACAVYPELQWDLTLYLGTLSCMRGDMVREETLLRLVRLPWFRGGSMPDDMRWLLIRELDQEKEKSIRSAIIDLLEKNPPPKETIAEDGYRLNLAVQRWLYRRNRKMRREMLRIMRTLPRSKVLQDHTLLRFLESARHSPLDIILPRRLRKLFYQNGVPAFGLRTSVRLILTSIVACVAWLGATMLVTPPGLDKSSVLAAHSTDNDQTPSNSQPSDLDKLALQQVAGAFQNRDSNKALSKVKGSRLFTGLREEPTLTPPTFTFRKIPEMGASTLTGTLMGQIVDPHGMPVTDAIVNVSNETSGNIYAVRTDISGRFALSYLLPGYYHITISGTKFETKEISHIIIQLGQSTALGGPLILRLRSTLDQAGSTPKAGAESPDGKSFVTISGRTAHLWEAATGKEIMTLFGATDTLRTAVFSPDGRYLATAGDDGAARLWDISTGQLLLILSEGVPLIDIRFSPDGKTITTYRIDGATGVWDARTGRSIK